MANYSKLDQQSIQEIISRYGMFVRSSEPINGGACNSSFLLNTEQGDFVLTVFDEHDQDYIARFCNILVHLKENNFKTSEIVSLKSGGYVSEVIGKPVILKTYLEGAVIRELDRNMFLQIGREMANLHQLPSADFIPHMHPHGVQNFYKVVDLEIDLEYEQWLGNKICSISEKINPDLPFSLIHGDLFYDNVLFLNNGLIAFIDFVESCNYFKIFDIGMAVVGQCIEDGELKFSDVRDLIEGYELVRNLEESEKEALQFYIEYAAVTISFWRFCRYNVDKIIPEMRMAHWNMVEISKKVSSIPKDDFRKYVFG